MDIADQYIKLLPSINYTLHSNKGSLVFKDAGKIVPTYQLAIDSTLFSTKKTVLILDDRTIGGLLDLKLNKSFPAFLLFPSHISNRDLSHFYQAIQEADKEDDVSQYLTQFDPDITRFKIFSDQSIKLKKAGKYQDISTFGDGLKSYIAIILALYSCKNGYLFIDEIENGIHYTQLERLWQIVLTISKQVNCQVFATTHSRECLEAYGKVAQQQNDDDISFITLLKDRQKRLQAITYSDKTFANSLMQHHEVRGS